jgi:hypothetical protein
MFVLVIRLGLKTLYSVDFLDPQNMIVLGPPKAVFNPNEGPNREVYI